MPESLVISEDLDSKMPQLIAMLQSKKSVFRARDKDASGYRAAPTLTPEALEEMIRDATFYDPTPTKKHAVYITTQLKFGNLHIEDAQRLGQTIETFMSIMRSPKTRRLWSGLLGEDAPIQILQYADWRKLEKDVIEFTSSYFYSEKDEAWKSKVDEKGDGLEEGAEVVTEFAVDAEEGPQEVKILEITTPRAAVIYGTGTTWCTRLLETDPERMERSGLDVMKWEGKTGTPNMAKSYMKNGPLYQIYLNGKPWIQITHNMDQLKNTDDHIMTRCSSFLDFVLSHLYNTLSPTPQIIKSINALRKLCINPNYIDRPPMRDVPAQGEQ
jgi:hypothetical protein